MEKGILPDTIQPFLYGNGNSIKSSQVVKGFVFCFLLFTNEKLKQVKKKKQQLVLCLDYLGSKTKVRKKTVTLKLLVTTTNNKLI